MKAATSRSGRHKPLELRLDFAELARGIGLEAIDVGPLRHARIIEGLHYLRANALGGRVNFHFPPDTARD